MTPRPSPEHLATLPPGIHVWGHWLAGPNCPEACLLCGMVRRADDGNKPCRGVVRVVTRDVTPGTGPDCLPVPAGWERVVQITGRPFLRRLPWCYVHPDGYGKWTLTTFEDEARMKVHSMPCNIASAEVACALGDAWFAWKEAGG